MIFGANAPFFDAACEGEGGATDTEEKFFTLRCDREKLTLVAPNTSTRKAAHNLRLWSLPDWRSCGRPHPRGQR